MSQPHWQVANKSGPGRCTRANLACPRQPDGRHDVFARSDSCPTRVKGLQSRSTSTKDRLNFFRGVRSRRSPVKIPCHMGRQLDRLDQLRSSLDLPTYRHGWGARVDIFPTKVQLPQRCPFPTKPSVRFTVFCVEHLKRPEVVTMKLAPRWRASQAQSNSGQDAQAPNTPRSM